MSLNKNEQQKAQLHCTVCTFLNISNSIVWQRNVVGLFRIFFFFFLFFFVCFTFHLRDTYTYNTNNNNNLIHNQK